MNLIDDENNMVFKTRICNSLLANPHDTSSVHIEDLSYSDSKQINDDSKVKAFERFVLSLLKEGNTVKAKSIIDEFNYYSSPLVDKWKTAFSGLPKKENRVASIKKHEIEADSKLIEKYKNRFTSQWIALVSGDFVASDKDLLELKKVIKSRGLIEDVTFVKL